MHDKGVRLGLLKEDGLFTPLFEELVQVACNDLNNDEQFRNKVLAKLKNPLYMKITNILDAAFVEKATLFCVVGSRVCEHMGELADVEFVEFIIKYMASLEDEGILKINKVRRSEQTR